MFVDKEPGKEFLILLLHMPDNIKTKYGEVINAEW